MSDVEWGPGIWSYRHHCRAREQGYSELIEYRNEFLTELISFSLGSKGLRNYCPIGMATIYFAFIVTICTD